MKDFEKIAKLLYPNLKHDSAYYEEKYPKRDLPKGAEVTRFAPSPTGYLHIGGFYQALVDSKVAKESNGVFYFRLEDTDKKREVDGASDIALKVLKEYGVVPMEGLMLGGEEVGAYGPYIQSERRDIYDAFAYELVKSGRAFPCFCAKSENKEDIEERREQMLKENATILEHDPCRDLSDEKIENEIKEGKPWALRLKSLNNEGDKIRIVDAVLGEREIPANTKDIVLIKSNGLPVYAFAHAIDDHLMRTTLVVRGAEWFPSLSAHLEVFEALGFEKLRYAHTGLISKIDNGNKRKLSKRKDPEANMSYFLENGYPKEAVVDYVMNLANSNFEIWRKQNPNASIDEFHFDVKKLNISDPMFDMVKLDDVSKNVISYMSASEVYDRLVDWASEYDKEFFETITARKDYVLGMLSIGRGGVKPRKDIAKMSEVKNHFAYMFDNDFEYDYDEKFTSEQINSVIDEFLKTYDIGDDSDVWFAKMKEACEKIGFCSDMKEYKKEPSKYIGSVADFSTIIRVAITGRRNSPDLCPLMKLLGLSEVISRFARAKR